MYFRQSNDNCVSFKFYVVRNTIYRPYVLDFIICNIINRLYCSYEIRNTVLSYIVGYEHVIAGSRGSESDQSAADAMEQTLS